MTEFQKVLVITPNGQYIDIEVGNQTTLGYILFYCNISKEVIIFNNFGKRLLQHDKTLHDYDLWFPNDENFVVKLFIYKI